MITLGTFNSETYVGNYHPYNSVETTSVTMHVSSVETTSVTMHVTFTGEYTGAYARDFVGDFAR